MGHRVVIDDSPILMISWAYLLELDEDLKKQGSRRISYVDEVFGMEDLPQPLSTIEFRPYIEAGIKSALNDYPEYRANIGDWYIQVFDENNKPVVDLRKFSLIGWTGMVYYNEFMKTVFDSPEYAIPSVLPGSHPLFDKERGKNWIDQMIYNTFEDLFGFEDKLMAVSNRRIPPS